MLRGLYIAGGGMTERAEHLEVLANNIANMQTNTFKRDRIVYSKFREMLLDRVQSNKPAEQIGPLALGSYLSTDTYTDFSQGDLTMTGDDHDIALQGDGFIKVSLRDGSVRYTRDGNWSITNDGFLIDRNGNLILDENGSEIEIKGSGKILIGENGEIRQGETLVGRIGLYEVADRSQLFKDGSSLYHLKDASPESESEAINTTLAQGYVERPNFSPVTVVTDLVILLREFESSQKAVQVVDETIDMAISKIGKVQ